MGTFQRRIVKWVENGRESDEVTLLDDCSHDLGVIVVYVVPVNSGSRNMYSHTTREPKDSGSTQPQNRLESKSDVVRSLICCHLVYVNVKECFSSFLWIVRPQRQTHTCMTIPNMSR